MKYQPISATVMGYPGFDDQLPPENETAKKEIKTLYSQFLKDSENIQEKSLSTDDRIDLQVIRTASQWAILNIDKTYPLGWRSETDLSDLVDTVYYNVTRQHGKESEWKAILKRMEAIPTLLKERRANLEIGLTTKAPFYKREVTRDGIELQDEVASYFGKDVLEAAKASLSKDQYATFEPKLKKAVERIDQALAEQVSFLQTKILPIATNHSFAIGEGEYAWRLKHLLFSSLTPQVLFEYGKKQVELTAKKMQSVADKISQSRNEKPKPYSEMVNSLQHEAPTSDDEMFAMYRKLVVRAVSFLREKKMFILPSDYQINIVETPAAFTNVLSVAAMNPIPPFLDNVPAQFWVTPTRTLKNPGGDPKLLELNHCRAAAPNLVVHEAVPGHDLQLGDSARAFIHGGRKNLSYLVRTGTPDVMSSLGMEGWAHYTEELMAEEGFYTPEEELFQLKDAQWRNVRIVVDVGIHTGRMSYEDAVRYFNEKTLSGDVTAEREIYRYSKWPLQAITYHLGKKDLLDLRRDAKEALGKKFNLAKFHAMVLTYDGVPVSFYHDQLLEDLKRDK